MTKRLTLDRLRPRFIALVQKYMDKNKLNKSEMAKLVAMQRTHLSSLMNNSADRPLSAYYLQKFIQRGIITVKEIYDGKAESDREADFWKQAKESDNWELLSFISKVRNQKQVDVLTVLKSIYPDVK